MNKIPLSVLVIDDDAGDAEILHRRLDDLAEFDVGFAHCPDIDAAQAELARPELDVIFVDYMLGADSGRDVLATVRATGDLRPYIALTGHGDERVAAAMMRAGADDYLVKGETTPATLRRAIDVGRAQHVRRKMEIMNRRLLEDLQTAKAALEDQNRRLADLYHTAHQFVDHVSHEFRTPLTLIREFATIMRDQLAGRVNDEQREYLDIISHRVDDLSVLVDDMLDISRLEAGVMGVCRMDCTVADIIEHVRQTLERRAAASSARLSLELSDDLPQVFCDAEKVGRVVINLVINALKFCGQPGRVTLRAVNCEREHEVRILVEDNGRGIPRDGLTMLFQRFRQLDGTGRAGVKGFGLGLSIAKELVDLNLGEISVESEVGAGSTFWFSIPHADRRSLIRRAVQRAAVVRKGVDWFSILRISCDPSVGAEALEDVERMVRRHTRHTDLLFRVRAHEWLLVAAANQPELDGLIQRLKLAHSQGVGETPARGAPPIVMRLVGSWDAHDEADTFIECFMEAENHEEPAYVA